MISLMAIWYVKVWMNIDNNEQSDESCNWTKWTKVHCKASTSKTTFINFSAATTDT